MPELIRLLQISAFARQYLTPWSESTIEEICMRHQKGALIGLLVVLLTTGCGGYQHFRAPSVDEVTGEWLHNEPNETTTRLLLKEDGSFEIAEMPSNLFLHAPTWDSLNWNDLVDCTGAWAVGTGPEESRGANPYLDLTFADCTGDGEMSTYLSVWGEGSDLSLYTELVSPDEGARFTFKKG